VHDTTVYSFIVVISSKLDLEELRIHVEISAQMTGVQHNVDILFSPAFQKAADKLLKHLSLDGGQPAVNFLKAVRILDPSRVCVLSQS
jgi:hypothetical protein